MKVDMERVNRDKDIVHSHVVQVGRNLGRNDNVDNDTDASKVSIHAL